MPLLARRIPIQDISLELGDTVLMRIYAAAVEEVEGGGDDFEEVCLFDVGASQFGFGFDHRWKEELHWYI